MSQGEKGHVTVIHLIHVKYIGKFVPMNHTRRTVITHTTYSRYHHIKYKRFREAVSYTHLTLPTTPYV